MNMEFTEKLITLVHQHPCLYDCRVKNYKNIAKKEHLWEQIAIELNQNSESVKTKWKNLKDGYAKFKKRKNNKYGNWVWGPYLGFLDGAAAMRNKIPSDACESPNSAEAREVSADLLAYNAEDNSADVDASAANSSIQEFLSLRDPLTSRRKRQASDDDYTDDKLSIQYNNMEQKDSIDLLFESYAKSLKQMKPRTQAAVKIKLAQIFADAELEDLQHKLQTGNQGEQIYTVLTNNENETFPPTPSYDNSIKRE